VRNALGALGRVLITLGLLILLFVGYQLWGTGLYTARAQSDLEHDFDRQLEEVPTEGLEQSPPPPPEGDAVARISIPKIGVDWIVVEGVATADLQKGPGHFPDTPMPGELGNAAIAGHRTTYGAPFHRLDELAAGDEIVLTTLVGTFHYVLDENPFTVRPNQVEVLLPRGFPERPTEAQLTLTTCHPKYSAAQRLIVKATLDPDGSAVPTESTREPRGELELAEGLSGDEAARRPMTIFGLLVLAVGGLWWLGFHRYPRWTTWIVGAVPFLIVLFFFYTFLERALGPYTNPFGS